jgi:hypothetical protein
MRDHLQEYYFEDCVDEELREPTIELIDCGKFVGREISVWTVAINSIFGNHDFLMISDETGEPVYFQNFNSFVFDVEKNDEGNYFMVKLG